MPFTWGITVLKNRVNTELLFFTVPISQKMEYYRTALAMRPLMACHTKCWINEPLCFVFLFWVMQVTVLTSPWCLCSHGDSSQKTSTWQCWRCHKSFKEECKAECQDKDLQGTGWGNSKSQSWVGSAGTPLTDKHERKRSKLWTVTKENVSRQVTTSGDLKKIVSQQISLSPGWRVWIWIEWSFGKDSKLSTESIPVATSKKASTTGY